MSGRRCWSHRESDSHDLRQKGDSRARDLASSVAEVLARRRQVERYLIRQLRPSEIAKLIRVSVATIYRDLQAIKRGQAKYLAHVKDVELTLQETLSEWRERKRSLWGDYHQAKNEAVKLGILRALREEASDIVALLQTLGALPKEPEKIEVSDAAREAARDEIFARLRALTAEREARENGVRSVDLTNRLSQN